MAPALSIGSSAGKTGGRLIDLKCQIKKILNETATVNVAIAFYDYETDTSWSFRGDTFFHAASTIKVAILMGVFAMVDQGVISLKSRVHVRNRFISAVDSTI